jgi:Na+/H+ antiporter NhaA
MNRNPLSWDKFKDVAIIAMIGFAVRIFQSNMEEMNKSVQDLNSKVGVVVVRTQLNENEIMTLRNQVRELELKVYSK